MNRERNRSTILLLTSTFPRWPHDTDPPFTYELSRRLACANEVHVIAPRCPGAAEVEKRDGICIRRFAYCFSRYEMLAYGTGILNKLHGNPLLYGLVPLFLLGEIVAAWRQLSGGVYTVINAHWLIPQGLAAWVALRLARSKAPLVCSLHGGDIFALRKLRWLKIFLLKRCRAVVVVSHAMRDTVIGMGVAPSAVHVIPMGVDLGHAFVVPADERRAQSILFVGRLVEKKGAAYLVHAFKQVLKTHPNSRLTIVGDGPEREAIAGLVQHLGLGGCIDMRGAVANAALPALYQSTEIVALPFVVDSHGDMEGFGLVTVEALGCGCAVVASDVPALRDSILDGITGLLVPPKDIGALAGAIVRLLDNADLRRELGKNGRAHAEKRYDWRHATERYEALFSAIDAPAGRRQIQQ